MIVDDLFTSRIMTIQSEFNDITTDLHAGCRENGKCRIGTFAFLGSLIGFSIHGWLCIAKFVKTNTEFCSTSIIIALLLELIFVVFYFIPVCISLTMNCIYPAKMSERSKVLSSKVPNLPKTPIPDHAYVSFNQLSDGKSRLQSSENRLHPIQEV
jgi:hypothetical protein